MPLWFDAANIKSFLASLLTAALRNHLNFHFRQRKIGWRAAVPGVDELNFNTRRLDWCRRLEDLDLIFQF